MLPRTRQFRSQYALMSMWCILWVAVSQAQAQTTKDLDLTVILFRPTDQAEKDIGSAIISSPTIAVPVNVASVTDLLNASHILADSDAIGLVYLLNPSLEKADGLTRGQTLLTLQVDMPPEAAEAFSDGFLIKVRYDERLITAILSRRNELEKLSSSSSVAKTEGCLASAVRAAALINDHLEARNQPLDHQMLIQFEDDIALLIELGKKLPASAKDVPQNEENACAVAADLDLKRRGFEDNRDASSSITSRWPQVRVVVRTLDGNGNPKPMLRVHWIPKALENTHGRDQQFPQFSTPTENLLPEADYVFYVTQKDDPAVLGKVDVAVRRRERSQPLNIDIQVVKP
jgi:hypothetical protein